jgi:hypothetical protein
MRQGSRARHPRVSSAFALGLAGHLEKQPDGRGAASGHRPARRRECHRARRRAGGAGPQARVAQRSQEALRISAAGT